MFPGKPQRQFGWRAAPFLDEVPVVMADAIVTERLTKHYGTACVGEPDEKTEENARKLGKRVARLTKMLTA